MSTLTRSDFIGSYLGQTVPKTRAILDKHIGKTIVIPKDVYLDHDGDIFGLEALATIKMYEKKHRIKIIYER